MKRTALFFCSLISFCTASLAADVRQGLVSYWPLDSADFLSNITPDVVGGNNMQLYNIFDSSSLAAGKFGQCFTFDSSLQQCTFFTGDPAVDLGLPATRNPAYSVLLWVKGAGVGQSDLRYFCESAVTTGNNNPLYALGTQAGGTTTGTRIYLRNSTGGVLVDTTTTNAVLDSAWHHIAMVYNNGAFTFYVDGQTTYTNSYTADATGIWDTTSIGGIVRAAFGNFFTGSVDDLGVWARALSKDEIQSVMTSSIQTPVPHFAPAFSVNPSGNSAKLLVGDSFNLKAGVYGTRPMTYQWAKNGTNVDGANSATLSLTNLTASDSGDYTLIASNDQGTSTSGVAKVTISAVSPPNITNALVAYWPLDTVIGSKTPDLVSGYDMTLVNMTAANNVVSGKWGNAMKFDNASHTLLQRVDNPGETLPLYKNPDFSISMWVNGAANQTDRRIWSEGSTTSNNQLFNLGTAHTGADGTLDSYIRTDTGATADHKYTTALVFDDTWHNIVYVQRQAGTAVSSSIYVDGVLDPIALAPMNPLTLNTTTIGGILRSSASSWFSGLIDEVAVWNRALTTDEIQILQSTSITNPPSHLQPLAINGFTSDLPAVASGGSTALRWDVSKDVGQVKISPLPGDVTSATVVGVGSTNVSLTNSTTFVLSVTRGVDSLSATTSVAVVSGVAPGWSVLDNFDTYNAGPLNQTKWWLDLRGNSVQIGASNANRFITTLAADSDATLDLHGHTVAENQSATLFFRMTIPAVPDATTPIHLVGLTDKNARALSDLVATTGDAVAGGFGPAVYPIVTADPNSGTNAWFLGARNGIGAALDYNSSPLEPGATYDVWLEITNAPVNPDFQSDIFTVYLKKEGDSAREKVFENYLSDRDPSVIDVIIGGMQPNLDKLVVAGDDAATSAQFDDFYIGAGTLSTLPIGVGQSSGPLPPLTVTQANGKVTITWTAGTLQSAAEVSGPWSNVTGGTTSPYSFTPANAHQFFRTTQ
jgi:hypothetical protein